VVAGVHGNCSQYCRHVNRLSTRTDLPNWNGMSAMANLRVQSTLVSLHSLPFTIILRLFLFLFLFCLSRRRLLSCILYYSVGSLIKSSLVCSASSPI
jgi:hypothetical protein